jgi:hypothetical protein
VAFPSRGTCDLSLCPPPWFSLTRASRSFCGFPLASRRYTRALIDPHNDPRLTLDRKPDRRIYPYLGWAAHYNCRFLDMGVPAPRETESLPMDSIMTCPIQRLLPIQRYERNHSAPTRATKSIESRSSAPYDREN